MPVQLMGEVVVTTPAAAVVLAQPAAKADTAALAPYLKESMSMPESVATAAVIVEVRFCRLAPELSMK